MGHFKNLSLTGSVGDQRSWVVPAPASLGPAPAAPRSVKLRGFVPLACISGAVGVACSKNRYWVVFSCFVFSRLFARVVSARWPGLVVSLRQGHGSVWFVSVALRPSVRSQFTFFPWRAV